MAKLGPEVKPVDQLYQDFFQPDFAMVNEALKKLISSGTVGHKMLDVRDDLGTRYQMRGYYVIK